MHLVSYYYLQLERVNQNTCVPNSMIYSILLSCIAYECFLLSLVLSKHTPNSMGTRLLDLEYRYVAHQHKNFDLLMFHQDTLS